MANLKKDAFGIQKLDLLSNVTPLEAMPNLGERLGLSNLFIKRDDEGGRAGGGNKIRKFERQFAKILEEKYDTVLIAGHPQSNAARALAGTAVSQGLKPVIIYKNLIDRKTEAFAKSGNRLLMNLIGATLVEVPQDADFMEFANQHAASLREQGAKPFILPFGASDLLGTLGYVDCAEQILQQVRAEMGRDPDLVVVSTGSCATHAGLIAGFAAHDTATRVQGFTILKNKDDATSEVARLTQEALVAMGKETVSFDVLVDDCALGEAYGITTPECLDAIRTTASLEGIFLDPVYSGKAMAGLISHTQQGLVGPDEIVVFVHTGGLPLLFAYADAFES